MPSRVRSGGGLFCSILLGILLSANLVHSQAVGQSHNTVPAANTNFIPNLQNFITDEPAKIFQETWSAGGFIASGCFHGTVASLTATPSSCTAYPGGYYTTEIGTVTYTNASTCWLIVHRDTAGNLANFVRQGSTHYLVDCADASQPALPTNSAWMEKVTTAGGSVTAVLDLRSFVPNVPSYLLAQLPAAGSRGRLAFVPDVGSGALYLDNGTAWVSESINPMTTAGDLIVGGAAGVPTRLPEGIANQVLGVNTGATGLEYKTVAAGSGISITPTAGVITVSQSVFPPTGSVTLYVGLTAPSSAWLLCDGSAYGTLAQPALSLVLIPNAGAWGRGTPVGNFTYVNGTSIFTLAANGLTNGQIVHMANSGGALPSSYATNTAYYVINDTLNTFQLSATSGGAAITGGDNGSGTNTLYNQIVVPDFRSRVPLGMGTGVGLSARSIGTTTGKETIAVADLPTHGHTVTDPGHTHVENTINGAGAVAVVSGAAGANNAGTASVNSTASSTTGVTVAAGSCASCTTAADGNMSPSLVVNYIIKNHHLWSVYAFN